MVGKSQGLAVGKQQFPDGIKNTEVCEGDILTLSNT